MPAAAHEPTVLELVNALLLFNEPVLNHRFQEMLSHRPEGAARTGLAALPERIVGAERAARQGAVAWIVVGVGRSAEERFRARGQLALLEAFLELAHSQVELLTFLAREAPTNEVRERFDTAARETRAVARTLRLEAEQTAQALVKVSLPGPSHGLRSVQEEEAPGDLLSQVESAIRASRAAGKEPRVLLLSHTGLRHLRDQGCFKEGEATLEGVRVAVDFGWDRSAFALQTYDVIPLEEIFADQES